MIRSYYYNEQLKKAAVVFANIFTGMTVRTGLDGCGVAQDVPVPIRYGPTERVVGALTGNNTQTNLHTLPMMSCFMTAINLAPERQKGIGTADRRTYLPQGGVFPNDVKVIKRVMPIPFNLSFELSIYASNTDQAFQIIEQILILFDYSVQVQFNDAAFDWAKITTVTLESGPTSELNYPVGTERAINVWTFPFTFETWLSPPMEVRHELIKQINTNIAQMDSCTIDEYGEDGELQPFHNVYTNFQVGVGVGSPLEPDYIEDIEPAQPGMESECELPTHYNAETDPECHAQPPRQ